MNDKVVDRSVGGDVAAIAAQRSANARRLYEIRFALAVSIVGAIQGAGDPDELDMEQLRVVAEEVEKILGFIKMQLKGHDDGNSREN